MASLRRTGQALLGAEDAPAGELVLYEATMEHEDGRILDFTCTVRYSEGGEFNEMEGRPLVLQILEGPTFGVMIVETRSGEAVLRLRQDED